MNMNIFIKKTKPKKEKIRWTELASLQVVLNYKGDCENEEGIHYCGRCFFYNYKKDECELTKNIDSSIPERYKKRFEKAQERMKIIRMKEILK